MTVRNGSDPRGEEKWKIGWNCEPLQKDTPRSISFKQWVQLFSAAAPSINIMEIPQAKSFPTSWIFFFVIQRKSQMIV